MSIKTEKKIVINYLVVVVFFRNTQKKCHAVNTIAANATAENQPSQHFYLKSIIMSTGWNSPTQKEGKPSLTFKSQSCIKRTKVHSTSGKLQIWILSRAMVECQKFAIFLSFKQQYLLQ